MRFLASLRPLVMALACALAAASAPRDALADESGPATFALIIGSNVSVDRDLAPLKYADDDAARNLDLFRLLGARTYLLTRLDDNTRRLHPQAAAEALEPRRAVLERAMAQIGSDVAQARDRHLETELYVLYAGHGSVENGEGYITLEDMRITGGDLARMLAPIPASHIHVIADACASYLFAYGRGPGGERRPLRGFQDEPQLASDPRIGLLLSTSSARESHEWDAFQAGVFSHEVRSGLYGAADADGDGRVSYREIAAFVARANEAIPNDRFRPDVHIKPPAQSDTLLDIRRGLGRRLDVEGVQGAHYEVEDGRGVRLLDFHNATGQTVHLVRPPPTGRVYVRRLDDDTEFTVPAAPGVIALSDLQSAPPRVASRGAAQEAFDLLFSLPFDRSVVDAYPVSQTGLVELTSGSVSRDRVDVVAKRGTPSIRSIVEWSAVGLGVAALGAGAYFSASAIETSHSTTAGASQLTIAEHDEQISAMNTRAGVAYVGGAVGVAAGLAGLLLWPSSGHIQAAATPQGGYVGYTQRF
ncbi:MAG: hypothetical protein ACLQVI_02765 [Polyangiaceae bacterium]|jgi:hypothetical protein